MCPDAALLAEVPLFQFLDDRERADLAQQLEVVRFATGESIFNYGDPGDALYVIRSGRVEVFFKNDTGERVVLEVDGPGDFFGELSLLDNGCRSASVTALEDTEALRVDRDDLQKYLSMRPQAAMDLLAAMGKRQRVTVEKLRHTASRNVNEEVADTRTTVQKCADWIAEFSGSIAFLVIHMALFAVWIALNLALPEARRFDPYPFGLLTMCVSLEAIFLSVFVLLSQNRQAAKDRVRADIEYDVNLKAELEIAHLHEKMDRLTADVLVKLEKLHALIPHDARVAGAEREVLEALRQN